MNIKNATFGLISSLFIINSLSAQVDSRVITTAVPFALISADPRSAALGDMGVATSADVYSQQWNPAKYAFATRKQAVAVTYTPYLNDIVNDIFLGNLVYYNRINERSAFAASLRFFSLGDVELRETAEQTPLIENPNELTLDASYSLRLSERFAMGVAARYLRSDLRIQSVSTDASAGNSFAVDISGYWQSEEIAYRKFNGRWRGGFNISNLGPKMGFDANVNDNFLPTNLRLGGGFDFILNDMVSKVSVTAEINKLLVPTPPVRDANGDIIEGEDDDVGFVSGIFQSFGDAPGGFSEELKEITWALSAEYWYLDSFAFRTGFFYEDNSKGARQFLALGAGFKMNAINFDASYLFSTARVQSPLEGTLRFGITINIGNQTYEEY